MLYPQGGIVEVLSIEINQYCMNGDAEYVQKAWMQTAYSCATEILEELEYNRFIIAVSKAMECTFKDIKQIWGSQDFKRGMKVRKATVALLS